ncbi:MAG: hypothetical protein ACKPKO_09380, partial [Candidatus Fonsibacter sp.]
DEIFSCSARHLARIKRYCNKNPDNIVIATGDTHRLECIDCIANQHDYDEYYNKSMGHIFPVGMFFRENKRITSNSDKCFKRDVFDEICFCSVKHLARVNKYCYNIPVKIVIATGDTHQLECIDCITKQ